MSRRIDPLLSLLADRLHRWMTNALSKFYHQLFYMTIREIRFSMNRKVTVFTFCNDCIVCYENAAGSNVEEEEH